MRTKRTDSPLAVLFVVLTCTAAAGQTPLGSAFTHQGYLSLGGSPVTGLCDFQFSLWNDPVATAPANQVAGPYLVANADVADGVFSVQIDFGSSPFHGQARWLAVAVRYPAGSGSFTTLGPRQLLTAAPYALYALSGTSLWESAGSDIFYNAGKVGIGTSIPDFTLSVAGDAIIGQDLNALRTQLVIGDQNTYDKSLIVAYERNTNRGDIHVAGDPWGSALTIADQGKIGINTIAPDYPLSVRGDAIIGQDVPAGVTQLIVGQKNTADKSLIVAYDRANNRGDIRIAGEPLGAALTIADGGNVGIGTGDPQGNRLKVAGDLNVTGDAVVVDDLTVGTTSDYSTSAGRLIVATAAPNWHRPLMRLQTASYGDIDIIHDGAMAIRNNHVGNVRTEILTVRNDGDSKNLIVYGNGDVDVRGVLTHASDARLKTEVVTIPDALEKVLALRGVSFKWKDRPDQPQQIGLTAQEVEPVVPEVVFATTDARGTKSVAYANLVALLIEAVKDQQRQIEQLQEAAAARADQRAQMADLGRAVTDLKVRLDAMAEWNSQLQRRLDRLDSRAAVAAHATPAGESAAGSSWAP